MSFTDAHGDANILASITTRMKRHFHDENLKVKLLYTEFQSQVDLVPVVKQVLPVGKIEVDYEEGEKPQLHPTIDFEPDRDELVRELEILYIHALLVGAYRESQAAEHTSRKNAMDNASSNGEELLAKLDIEYNRGRQAKITQEISEIIGGAESLK